jgi:hypothetical protein
VAQEDLADGGAGRAGFSSPMRGSTLSVGMTGRPRARQQRGHVVARLDVAGEHHRHRCRAALSRRRERAALCRSTSSSPPSVPPTRAARCRAGGAQLVEPGRSSRPVETRPPAPAGQAHPMPGLGGDELLVADHGEPQTAPAEEQT